jgi:hypothetical protein
MLSLLKKKEDAHLYNRWVKLREVHDPLLRRARKRRRSVTHPIYRLRPEEVEPVFGRGRGL